MDLALLSVPLMFTFLESSLNCSCFTTIFHHYMWQSIPQPMPCYSPPIMPPLLYLWSPSLAYGRSSSSPTSPPHTPLLLLLSSIVHNAKGKMSSQIKGRDYTGNYGMTNQMIKASIVAKKLTHARWSLQLIVHDLFTWFFRKLAIGIFPAVFP